MFCKEYKINMILFHIVLSNVRLSTILFYSKLSSKGILRGTNTCRKSFLYLFTRTHYWSDRCLVECACYSTIYDETTKINNSKNFSANSLKVSYNILITEMRRAIHAVASVSSKVRYVHTQPISNNTT